MWFILSLVYLILKLLLSDATCSMILQLFQPYAAAPKPVGHVLND
jgi:hypothetical protein